MLRADSWTGRLILIVSRRGRAPRGIRLARVSGVPTARAFVHLTALVIGLLVFPVSLFLNEPMMPGSVGIPAPMPSATRSTAPAMPAPGGRPTRTGPPAMQIERPWPVVTLGEEGNSLALYYSPVRCGGLVRILGRDWRPGEKVGLYVDWHPLDLVRADVNGRFELDVPISAACVINRNTFPVYLRDEPVHRLTARAESGEPLELFFRCCEPL